MSEIVFNPPPTCSRFMQSDSFGRIIAGPVGSGKTTAVIFELLRRACEQEPGEDGIRYTRFAIVRSTLKALKDTVLPDITQTWLADIAEYRVSESRILFRFGDVHSDWLLIPLESPDDQKRLLSLQLTMGWLSESIEMPTDLIAPLAGRLGRYPSGKLGVPTFHGWVADTNMPSVGSPWHKLMTEPPPGVEVYIQPSGMADNAENLEYLVQTPETKALSLDDPEGLAIRRAQGRKYYERFVETSNPLWVKRYVFAEFGPDPSGTAVYGASYNRDFHTTDHLDPALGRLLIVGLDFGRDPCAAICQVNARGQFLVLEEIIVSDMGLEQMIKTRLRPTLMDDRYLGCPTIIVGDPAGKAKNTMFEMTSFDMLQNAGFAAMPAPTNDTDKRIAAVDNLLLGAVQGEPMFLIDRERCPVITRAMDGGYRFAYNKAGIRKPSPEKDEYSHPSDALQYAALASSPEARRIIQGRILRKPVKRERPKFSSLAWT